MNRRQIPLIAIILFLVILIVLLSVVVISEQLPNQWFGSQEDNQAIVSSSSSASKDSNVLARNYSIVDTNQTFCTNATSLADCVASGEAFFGQDAQYVGQEAKYVANGDGTVSDVVTGLMWQQDPGEKMSYAEAIAGIEEFNLAGYDDWRVPTIKELYSLMDFMGTDPSSANSNSTAGLTPFLDDEYFAFSYGNPDDGDRIIDSQWVTSSTYTSTVMSNQECFFGVNFADGRIKCYPTQAGKGYFVIYVRGNSNYGVNNFENADAGYVYDSATGLTWQQTDNEKAVNWENALSYCEELEFGGYTDWRLPSIKELQSLVDYDRSPDFTNSAAIDPVFQVTEIVNEAGDVDYGFYWSSTTHLRSDGTYSDAAYISFGHALGYMEQFGGWVDVHGAGAQRSDPKIGSAADYPQGHGPQGDAIRSNNYVRCVRSDNVVMVESPVQSSTLPETNSTASSAQAASTPPTEAIAACANKQVNTTCSFQAPDRTVTGTCKQVADGMACVP